MISQYAHCSQKNGSLEDQKGQRMDPMQARMADQLVDRGKSRMMDSLSINKACFCVFFWHWHQTKCCLPVLATTTVQHCNTHTTTTMGSKCIHYFHHPQLTPICCSSRLVSVTCTATAPTRPKSSCKWPTPGRWGTRYSPISFLHHLHADILLLFFRHHTTCCKYIWILHDPTADLTFIYSCWFNCTIPYSLAFPSFWRVAARLIATRIWKWNSHLRESHTRNSMPQPSHLLQQWLASIQQVSMPVSHPCTCSMMRLLI
jgi:hypothetical protein